MLGTMIHALGKSRAKTPRQRYQMILRSLEWVKASDGGTRSRLFYIIDCLHERAAEHFFSDTPQVTPGGA